MVLRRAVLPSVSFAKGRMGVLRSSSSRKWAMDASWSVMVNGWLAECSKGKSIYSELL
jgi:hypothetical protein